MPLWAQLHEELLRRLKAGAFTEQFPGEHELQRTYDVSRHTVREALRRMRETGLIDSSRGRSTSVRTTTIEQPLGSLYSLFREVEARGLAQRSTVLVKDLRTDHLAAAHLKRPADEELFYLERVRFADDQSLAHDKVWLPQDVGRHLMDSDFTHAALYDEMARRAGVRLDGGTERITAVVPNPQERSLLSVPRGTACFSIQRTGCRGRQPQEFRHSIVRADLYALLASWSPSGYQLRAGAPAGSPPT
jgi:GntR family transcriptional regulator